MNVSFCEMHNLLSFIRYFISCKNRILLSLSKSKIRLYIIFNHTFFQLHFKYPIVDFSLTKTQQFRSPLKDRSFFVIKY